MESKPTIAVGVVSRSLRGKSYSDLIAKAMSDEVLRCNEEGISTEEINAPIIHQRMMAAREREKQRIDREGMPKPPCPPCAKRSRSWLAKTAEWMKTQSMVR